jgi:D-aminopeptidase
MRAREIGIAVGTGIPGPDNAITDVRGVRVGHTTLIEGAGPLVVGRGPVRTGVTVVVPHESIAEEPVFAGSHRLNGNGELTGLEWIRESGMLTTPIALTNTHSVGVVRDALVAADVARRAQGISYWSLPVVGETWDGTLNDINGMHVRPEHVTLALDAAASGPIPEGNVGGGTGMICHGFKGGIGTASRVVVDEAGGYTVGVLVQANHGRRNRLRVNGVPVGEVLGPDAVALPGPVSSPAAGSEEGATPEGVPPGTGSIIVLVATDAPLLPTQCDRLAQRAGLGIARMGGVGEHSSGDLFLAFSVGNRIPKEGKYQHGSGKPTVTVEMLSNRMINHLFDAVIESTEEAILNALLAAETMTGCDDVVVHRLEPDRLQEVLERYAPRHR